MNHIILAAGWISYGLIHSVLASPVAKKIASNYAPRLAVYYRIAYNILATLGFLFLLIYQARIDKVRLWAPSLALTVLGGALAGIGLGVILLALSQYDLSEFSGMDAFDSKGRKKSQLKTTGLSAMVRHPLYTGTILLLWGFWLLDSSLSRLIMAICLTGYIRVGIYYEEKKLLAEFGDQYAHYCQRVPMLFPSRL